MTEGLFFLVVATTPPSLVPRPTSPYTGEAFLRTVEGDGPLCGGDVGGTHDAPCEEAEGCSFLCGGFQRRFVL